MKVVVAGNNEQALFLTGSLIEAGHEVTAICSDAKQAETMSRTHKARVIRGNPTKRYILDDAELNRCDIVIALMASDADNLVICQSAARFYGVPKQVCTVGNPRNVDIFSQLGVPIAISATYQLAQSIEQASTNENLSLEEALDDLAS